MSRILMAAALAVSGLAAAPSGWASSPSAYGYVLLAQAPATGATVPLARVVIDSPAQPCPGLIGTVPGPVIAMTPRVNPNPAAFAVTVCEAIYPVNQAMRVENTTIVLPVYTPAAPGRVAVVGDTGCKDKKGKQDCKKSDQWPFQAIAGQIAAGKPNLAIHVGDYNYRGTPGHVTINGTKCAVYDAGDLDDEDGTPPVKPTNYCSQNMTGSDTPDSWDPWKKDFFEPAQGMLAVAPWIFNRGNHELCSRAGPGFNYFLDQGSALLPGGSQTVCPNQNGPTPLLFNQPYAITLGSLTIAVIDSTNADDTDPQFLAQYVPQMNYVAKLTAGAPRVWVTSHRPFWGIMKGSCPASEPKCKSPPPSIINETLEQALAKGPGKFAANVELVVAGHMHRFQALGFQPGTGRPPQLITGNGGVEMSHGYPKHSTKGFSEPGVDGLTAAGSGTDKTGDFGFLMITPGAGNAWSGQLLDQTGKQRATCTSAWVSPATVCTMN